MVERLKRLLDSRFRISTQLYLAVGGAVVLTLAASLVGWFSFDRVGTVQSRVNEGSVPELAAAFGVAQYSGVLVAAAPNLTAATTPDEFDQVVQNIDEAYAAFEEQLATLEARENADQERVGRIRGYADTLISNIEALRSETSGVFELRQRLAALQEELTQVRFELDDLLAPAIDDQLFYILTGFSTLGESAAPRSEHFVESEIVRYRRLSELQGDVNIATELLANAFTLSDASLIEPLRERFEAANNRIDRNLGTLEGTAFHSAASPVFDRLFALGTGEQSVFGLFEQELRIEARQVELLASNRDLSIVVVAEVDGLVMAAQASAEEATEASSSAIFTGRTLLLVISTVERGGGGAHHLACTWAGSCCGASTCSRPGCFRMAGGDIETSVEMDGQDEVADMAAALESVPAARPGGAAAEPGGAACERAAGQERGAGEHAG